MNVLLRRLTYRTVGQAARQIIGNDLDILGRLGADQIAGLFRQQQITGLRLSATSCPVARYLQQSSGLRPHQLGVVDRHIAVHDNGATMTMRMPDTVVAFVRRFDAHLYPDLEG